MKHLTWILLGFLQSCLVHARSTDLLVGDTAVALPHERSRLFSAHGMDLAALTKEPPRGIGIHMRGQKPTPQAQVGPAVRLAAAIARAGKVGLVERSVEGYSQVLIDCQKSQLTISTKPLLRSDSQQAHCYRF
jgi:hypothetical protein